MTMQHLNDRIDKLEKKCNRQDLELNDCHRSINQLWRMVGILVALFTIVIIMVT